MSSRVKADWKFLAAPITTLYICEIEKAVSEHKT